MVGYTKNKKEKTQNAGVAGVGVSYGVHGRDRQLQLNPLACDDNIAELATWFEACEIAVADEGLSNASPKGIPHNE